MSATKRRRKGGRRFIQLWTNVKRSEAYHSLSVYARCLLIELLDRYTGINNGMIGLGTRDAALLLKCGHATVCRAMRELDDSGLAQPTTVGVWRGKRATEWRLTFYPCHKTGELPILNWVPFSGPIKKHKDPLQKHKPPLRSARAAQKPKNPAIESPLRSAPEAHIDIHHRCTDPDMPPTGTLVTEPDPFPDLPDFLDRRSKKRACEHALIAKPLGVE
jgi:hypothetical protein